MIFNIRTRFFIPSGMAINVLISDKYTKKLISTNLVEKILQNTVDQLYCEYFEEGLVIHFKQGSFFLGK